MSLDVYLEGAERAVDCFCHGCGHEHTYSEAERFYDDNITHNLIPMAQEAGVYDVVWRPEENSIERAAQLVEPLRKGVELMRADPERFKRHDSPNGWGLYKHFLPWLEKYLAACEEYPGARVRVSR